MPDASDPLDVLSFGESLVDFLPDSRGTSLDEVESFRKVVGGAPTNLTVGVARLGRSVGLLGKVGEDPFGDFVLDRLEREGIDLVGVARTGRAQTGLTFVTLDEEGDRSFLFYRDPSADMTIEPDDVDPDLFERARIFQLGSNLLTDDPVRGATERALDCAERAGCLVSFDPNVRMHLWPSEEQARTTILRIAGRADIVKVNEEELALLAGTDDPQRAWRETFAERGTRALALTTGRSGARLVRSTGSISVDAPDVEVVDTTGAGDGFVSGLLAGLAEQLSRGDSERSFDDLTDPQWRAILDLACHVGSRVCTELGATPGLPRAESLPDHLRSVLDHSGAGSVG